MNTIDKINNLIETGKIYEYAGRCWFTCYMTYYKLTKKEKSEVVLVEGQANGFLHYWLEVNGVVVDPHYKLINDDMEVEENYTYEPLKRYDFSKVVVDREYYEDKPAVNWLGREKWAKVYDLEFE
tara:strand:+ start:148 stop:522 length:375 start_codon:yes stop_codon:yes gene_type:complete